MYSENKHVLKYLVLPDALKTFVIVMETYVVLHEIKTDVDY